MNSRDKYNTFSCDVKKEQAWKKGTKGSWSFEGILKKATIETENEKNSLKFYSALWKKWVHFHSPTDIHFRLAANICLAIIGPLYVSYEVYHHTVLTQSIVWKAEFYSTQIYKSSYLNVSVCFRLQGASKIGLDSVKESSSVRNFGIFSFMGMKTQFDPRVKNIQETVSGCASYNTWQSYWSRTTITCSRI